MASPPPADDDATDEALAARVAAGDRAAFDELFRRYDRRLRGYLAVSYGIARGDEDDVAQEVWFKAAKAVRGWTPRPGRPNPFRGWLFTVAGTVAVDFHRRPGRRQQPLPEAVADALPAGDSDPGRRLDAEERNARLRACIGQLPEDFRRVVEMDMDDYSSDEIAAALGINPVTARTRKARALDRLRACLEARPR